MSAVWVLEWHQQRGTFENFLKELKSDVEVGTMQTGESFGHVRKSRQKKVGIVLFKNDGQIFRNGLLAVEIGRGIEIRDFFFHGSLQCFCQVFGPGDVPVLRRFVAAAKKEDHRFFPADEIQAVVGAYIDPDLQTHSPTAFTSPKIPIAIRSRWDRIRIRPERSFKEENQQEKVSVCRRMIMKGFIRVNTINQNSSECWIRRIVSDEESAIRDRGPQGTWNGSSGMCEGEKQGLSAPKGCRSPAGIELPIGNRVELLRWRQLTTRMFKEVGL